MKSFGAYISKHLASFTAFILMLLFINGVIFGMTFHKTFTVDYGENSPHIMLEMTAAAISQTGISEEAKQKLHQNNIWAIYYMESTDDRLDLRHGLGLILVRQIVEAHNGSMTIESTLQHGCKTVMNFPK